MSHLNTAQQGRCKGCVFVFRVSRALPVWYLFRNQTNFKAFEFPNVEPNLTILCLFVLETRVRIS